MCRSVNEIDNQGMQARERGGDVYPFCILWPRVCALRPPRAVSAAFAACPRDPRVISCSAHVDTPRRAARRSAKFSVARYAARRLRNEQTRGTRARWISRVWRDTYDTCFFSSPPSCSFLALTFFFVRVARLCSQGAEFIRVSRFYKEGKEGKFVTFLHEDTRTLYDGFRRGAKESSKWSFTFEERFLIFSQNAKTPKC